MIGFFTGGHMICLYSYQTPFIQDVFPPGHLWARLFGLNDIILNFNCTGSVDDLILNQNHDWPVYVNPGILLLLYYGVTSLLKLRRPHKGQKGRRREPVGCDPPKAKREDLELANLEPWTKERYSMGDETKPMIPRPSPPAETDLQDCTVHVILPPSSLLPGTSDSSPRPSQEPHAADKTPGKEQSPLHMLSQVILHQSYICALIAMMVWSITYHSWLTFVLLLWACLIWMVRNKRHCAMLCSPFILLYALTLCSLQYVWGMDLQPELPTRLGFMRLSQLGLVRAPYPCLNLGAMVTCLLNPFTSPHKQ
ncbi:hypothetical protein FKM82_028272 [Ascaphus truei]